MGVDFSATAMIGRQALTADLDALRKVFAVLGIKRDAKAFLQQNTFGEAFFAALGAAAIESVDVSPYEGATILHNMNHPVPSELHQRFTVVHDGGTIEHVFNAVQAFKNCMAMVRVGGHFTQVNAANNFAGHGFWQFSPELIFRMFSPANGFQVEAVLMHEVVPGGRWYVVADPDSVRWRVELCNSDPTYILTIARRIASVPIFAEAPYQSDYVSMWDRTLNAQPEPPPVTDEPPTWRHYIPQPVKRSIRAALASLTRPRDGVVRGFRSRAYRRIEEDAVLRGAIQPQQGAAASSAQTTVE
jgi:hypothetical protein